MEVLYAANQDQIIHTHRNGIPIKGVPFFIIDKR